MKFSYFQHIEVADDSIDHSAYKQCWIQNEVTSDIVDYMYS